MKFSKILTTLLTCGPALIKAASQDYARHLELSILFYEGIFYKMEKSTRTIFYII